MWNVPVRFKRKMFCKNASLPKEHLRMGRTREIIINITCIEIRNFEQVCS